MAIAEVPVRYLAKTQQKHNFRQLPKVHCESHYGEISVSPVKGSTKEREADNGDQSRAHLQRRRKRETEREHRWRLVPSEAGLVNFFWPKSVWSLTRIDSILGSLIFYFWTHISFSFSLVYIKSSPFVSTLFMNYLNLIKSLTNIDNIQVLDDEPTAHQTEYIHIATTSQYKLYFKIII